MEKAKVTASDAADNDWFAGALDMEGSLAVIGARGDDDKGSVSGSAYLFNISDPANPVQTAKITASDGAANDWFGRRVAMSGNYAVIGAPREDGAGSSRGAVYLFDISDPANPVEKAKIAASDAADNDEFGDALAIKGNLVLVGSYLSGGMGQAYLYDISDPANPTELKKFRAADTAAGDRFGSVAISADFALVGANQYTGGNGKAYLFDITDPANPVEVGTLVSPVGATDDGFGTCVSLTGSLALVGAAVEDSGGGAAADRGAAYLFRLPYACTQPLGTAGVLLYNSSQAIMQYCDGANWVGIGK